MNPIFLSECYFGAGPFVLAILATISFPLFMKWLASKWRYQTTTAVLLKFVQGKKKRSLDANCTFIVYATSMFSRCLFSCHD
jgi:Tfp pilus assembly protein FimT